ncbi:MAG TPA: hypothetical protein GX513_03385 [Firmicutes bacterium]|nr:hypothetical protein [Bacillota bacterium]
MLAMWVRPYNSDAGILEQAISEGFQPDGVIMDANVALYFRNVRERMVEVARSSGARFAVDPNTAKIRVPFFRQKRSFKRLPYYAGEIPSLDDLMTGATTLAEQVITTQLQCNSDILLSPYFFLDEAHFPTSRQLDLQDAWHEAFLSQAPADYPIYLAVCISIQALSTPEGRESMLLLLRRYQATRVYLLLVDLELGESTAIDHATLVFFQGLKALGVEDLLLGRAPYWAPLLNPHGLTGFVTGINYMSTMRREYLTRDEDIDRIVHNFYLARRFTKAVPPQVERIYDEGLLEPCSCPACLGAVPFDTLGIRKHYLFARGSEVAELDSSQNPRAVLRHWLDETAWFIQECDASAISLINLPPIDRWVRLLEE